jgi:hypothetical protein
MDLGTDVEIYLQSIKELRWWLLTVRYELNVNMWVVLTFEVAALYLSRDQWYPRYIGKCVSSMFFLDEEAKRKIRLPGRKLRTTLQSMARNFTKL